MINNFKLERIGKVNLLVNFFKNLYHDTRGGTSFEYAIIVALIAVTIIIAVTVLGLNIEKLFEFEFPSPF